MRLRKKRCIRYLVKSLIREPIRNVRVEKDWITFNYDGTTIRNKIVFKKHEPFVGNWSKKKNEVYIDDDLAGKLDIRALALHEAVEKFVCQKYGLSDNKEGHQVATAKERMFLERIDGKWDKHEKKVEKVWNKEAKS